MKGTRVLERGRLVFLRRPAARDRDAFVAAARRSRSLHGSWLRAPDQPDQFDAWLRRGRRERYEHMLVCRNDTDAIAGVINLGEIVRGAFQNAFVGYYAFVDHAGGGRMTEGLRLAARYAFDDLKLHRLEANIQPENDKSIALARRAGFEYEGTARKYLKIAGRWRDHEHWVRVRE